MVRPTKIFILFFLVILIAANLFSEQCIHSYLPLFQFYLEHLAESELELTQIFGFLFLRRLFLFVAVAVLLYRSRGTLISCILMAVLGSCLAYLSVLSVFSYGMYAILLLPLLLFPQGVFYGCSLVTVYQGRDHHSKRRLGMGMLLVLLGIMAETMVNYPLVTYFLKKI